MPQGRHPKHCFWSGKVRRVSRCRSAPYWSSTQAIPMVTALSQAIVWRRRPVPQWSGESQSQDREFMHRILNHLGSQCLLTGTSTGSHGKPVVILGKSGGTGYCLAPHSAIRENAPFQGIFLASQGDNQGWQMWGNSPRHMLTGRSWWGGGGESGEEEPGGEKRCMGATDL